MPSIQFKKTDSVKEDGIQKEMPVVEAMVPVTDQDEEDIPLPQLRENRFNIQIKWIPNTRMNLTFYFFLALILTVYYFVCFGAHYGSEHFEGLKDIPILSEPVLTRVIMVEWLLLAAVLLLGIFICRRVFMPLYIYLAVMATNGTLILFMVKYKQFNLGQIAYDDLALNLVGILLLTACTHNFVYLYAVHLHLRAHYYGIKHRSARPAAVSAQNEEKKDLSAIP